MISNQLLTPLITVQSGSRGLTMPRPRRLIHQYNLMTSALPLRKKLIGCALLHFTCVLHVDVGSKQYYYGLPPGR